MGQESKKRKERTLQGLREMAISQMRTLAYLTGFEKFCKEKGMLEEADKYANDFVNSLKNENNVINDRKLGKAIEELRSSK